MKNRKRNWMAGIVAVLLLVFLNRPYVYAVSSQELHNPVSETSTHVFKGTHETDFSYVYFGMYPQKEITGDELTDAIRNAAYDKYGDAVVNGRKYRHSAIPGITRKGFTERHSMTGRRTGSC